MEYSSSVWRAPAPQCGKQHTFCQRARVDLRAWIQLHEYSQPAIADVVQIALHRHRQVNVRNHPRFDSGELLFAHPNDLERILVEPEGPAKHIRIAPEAAFPILVGDYGIGFRVLVPVVVFREEAAESAGLTPKDGKSQPETCCSVTFSIA